MASQEAEGKGGTGTAEGYGEQVELYDKPSGLKYLLYKPRALLKTDGEAREKKSFPLLVFLHGAGESGSGSAKGIIAEGIHGCPPVEIHHKRALPELYERFIVASPRTDRGWGDADRIKTFTQNLIDDKSLAIDKKRVYLTGVSMGGAGVWNGARTGLFAALVPVCAAGMARAKDVNVPVWAFHGANDVVVPVGYTDHNIGELKKAHPDLEIKYTRYKDSPCPIGYPGYDGHASWMQVYSGEEVHVNGKVYKEHHGKALFEWMLGHSLQ